MTLARDMQELMHRVRRTPGYTVRITKNGHWQVRDMDDHLLVTASSTPSDWRALRKVSSHLRAAGVPLNGKQKWEREPDSEEQEPPSQLPASQERLLANVNAYLADQGHEDGKRDGLRAEFARKMMAVGKERKMRVFKTTASAEVTLSALLKHGRGITPWAEALIAETLETLWAEKEQAEREADSNEKEARELAEAEQARVQSAAERNQKQQAQVKALRPVKKSAAPRKRAAAKKKTTRRRPSAAEAPYFIGGAQAVTMTASNASDGAGFIDKLDLCLRLQAFLLAHGASTDEATKLVREVGEMLVR